jgi:hypothetical protein
LIRWRIVLVILGMGSGKGKGWRGGGYERIVLESDVVV